MYTSRHESGPEDEFITTLLEPEVPWGTVLADLTLQYSCDRSDPDWKEASGMARAMGVVLRKYRKDMGFSRGEVARGLGLIQQFVFCAEHGLAVDRSGPLFELQDRYSRLEAFQLEIRDQLGVTDIESFDQLVRQAFLELDDNE